MSDDFIRFRFYKEIKPELDRRLNLITSSVVGSFLSGDNPDNTSIRHVLNRVMVLLQIPLTFVIFEAVENRYEGRYMFNRHPRDQKHIMRCIEQVNEDGSPIKVDGNRTLELFQLFGTRYYLLAIVIGKRNGNHNFYQLQRLQSEATTPETNDDLAAYQLEKILDEERYKIYGEYFLGLLKNSILTCIRNGFDRPFYLGEKPLFPVVYDPSIKTPSVDQEKIDDIEIVTNKLLLSNKNFDVAEGIEENGYLDRVFRKIKDNLKAISRISRKNDQLSPANYVVFVRDYAGVGEDGERYRRHEIKMEDGRSASYDYRVRIALCEKQKKDIVEYFYFLKKNIKSNKNIYPTSLNLNYAEESLLALAQNMDDFFWKALESSGDDFENLINIIESNFGIKTRSAADLVFDGGVIHFRRPFSDGGISRCFPNLPQGGYPTTLEEVRARREEFGDIENDLKRLVVCFYWYNGMTNASIREGCELGIMLTPIEVGNRIWCVVGYFTTLYDVKEKEKNKIGVDANTSAWSMNYHIFQDVNDRLKKDLRHSMSNCYRDVLSHYYARSVGDFPKIFEGIYTEKERKLKLQEWLNQWFEAATVFFPYDKFCVTVKPGRGSPSKSDSLSKETAVAKTSKRKGSTPISPCSGAPLSQHWAKKTGSDWSPGLYLTEDLYCDTRLENNGFFPFSPGVALPKDGKIIYNHVNERDIQVRLTNAFVIEVWRKVIEENMRPEKDI